MYDYLIVGAGLYGAVFAQEAKRAGKSVLVIDKRPHIAGNVYTEKVEGINVHKYGAHISIPIIRSLGLYHPVCHLQSFYQQSGCQLSRGAVQSSV